MSATNSSSIGSQPDSPQKIAEGTVAEQSDSTQNSKVNKSVFVLSNFILLSIC